MTNRCAAIGVLCLVALAGCSSGPTAPEPRSGSAAAEPRDPLDLSMRREQAIALLVSMATNGSPEERANAIEGLIDAPRRLLPLVGDALTDPNEGVRAVAAMGVARARLAQAAPRVRPLLTDQSPRVRAAAIWALHANGQPVDPSPLASMLESPNPGVRGLAAFVIGEMGDRSAAPMLRETARAQPARAGDRAVADQLVDLQVAEALVKLGDPEAIHQIRAALYPARPTDLEAAALAAQIIGQVGDEVSADQLIVLTARRDEMGNPMPAEVRLAAASSLARLGLPRGGFIADEFLASPRATLRAQAANVLGEIGDPERLPALEDGMADPDGRVRIAAAVGVLKLADRGASVVSGAPDR